MNYTVLFVIMSIVLLVANGIIYTDIIAIRKKIEIVYKFQLERINKLEIEWEDSLEGWRNSVDGWRSTIETSNDILEELKKVTERRE